MLPPYQCLQQCGGVLLAAALSRLDVYNIDDACRLSSWACPTSVAQENPGSSFQPPEENDFQPPAKKRRLSDPRDHGETTVGNGVGHRGEDFITAAGKQEAPTIIALAATRGGEHVIVVTGEDKSIRVLKHDGRGKLGHISQRVMPKRPCAVALTTDESAILCADKFGDVYSIPLLFEDSLGGIEEQEDSTETIHLIMEPSKTFVSAANDLTVHSIRNRRALQNQMKQKLSISKKSKPQFERKLLLGHVSMLTDIAVVDRDGQNYIITADRDEHIRISRGIPQAHIIEGYCLGHKDFVSRLCLLITQPNLLISGGGDDEIYVWDWFLRRLLHKVNLKCHAEQVAMEVNQGAITEGDVARNDTFSSEPVKIAVSNIQHMERALNQEDDLIMVTCEGVPAIFIFSLLEDSTLSHYQTIRLEGNPLGLVIDSGLKIITVSVDGTHEPGSIDRSRTDLEPVIQPLQSFQKIDADWVKRPLQFNVGSEAAQPVSYDQNTDRDMADLLYPIQKLRKLGSED